MAEDIVETANLANSGQCRLLALPAELRNEIWKLVLPEGKAFCTCRKAHDRLSRCKTGLPYQPPAVLSVCRQIQSEAGGLWYPHLDIHPRAIVVQDLLYVLGTAKASLIRSSTYFYPYRDWLKAEELLYTTLYVSFLWNRMPAPGALKFRLRFKLDDGTEVETISSNPRETAAEHGLDVSTSLAVSRFRWKKFRENHDASPLTEEDIKEVVDLTSKYW